MNRNALTQKMGHIFLNRPADFTFRVLVVLLQGVGIASTTLIFAAIESAILRPLQFPDGDRIAIIEGAASPGGMDVLAWWRQSRSFEDLAVYSVGGANLGLVSVPRRVNVAATSASLFSVLGAQPIVGRPFRTDEEMDGASRVALLSYSFWVRQFAGEKDVVARGIHLNGVSYQIIGVMPPNFAFPPRTDLWVPRVRGKSVLDFTRDVAGPRQLSKGMIGRLAQGVTIAGARSELNTLLARLQNSYGRRAKAKVGSSIAVVQLREFLVGPVRTPLLALFGAVILLMLIASVNSASLLLARSLYRIKEIAIRVALGATPTQIAFSILRESVALSVIGGALGIGIAYAFLAATRVGLGVVIGAPRITDARLNAYVVLFALLLSIASGIAVGMPPAIRLAKRDLIGLLSTASPRCTRGLSDRTRMAFVVCQVSVALVLSIGASLLIESVIRLTNIDPGFSARPDTHIAEVVLPEARYGTVYQLAHFQSSLMNDIRRIPTVTSTGATDSLPLGGGQGSYLSVIHFQAQSMARYALACGEYFQTMGIPVVAGRAFEDRDQFGAEPVVILSRTAARRLSPERPIVGAQVLIEGEKNRRKVIGVVGDVKAQNLGALEEAQIYMPFLQPYRDEIIAPRMSIVVRSRSGHGVSWLRDVIQHIDTDLPVFGMRSLDDLVYDSAAATRSRALLFTICAGIALLLAALGVYGIVSFSISAQTREIGIRIALGAHPWSVFFQILRSAAVLTLVGVALGLGLALWLNSLLSSLLFGVTAGDFISYSRAVVSVFLSALAASSFPALKAASIDPNAALREH